MYLKSWLTTYLKSNSTRAFSGQTPPCPLQLSHHASVRNPHDKNPFLANCSVQKHFSAAAHLLHSKAEVSAVQQFSDTDPSLYQAQMKTRNLTQKPPAPSPGQNSRPASPVVSSVPIPEAPCRGLGKESTNKIRESAVYQIMEVRARRRGIRIPLGAAASSQCQSQS